MASYVACPKCGTPEPTLLKFTWWGGALGPRILTHVKCVSCKNKFNGKNGGTNGGAILLYSAVVFAITFSLFIGVGILLALSK